MLHDLDRFAKNWNEGFDERMDKIQINVMVLGPNTDKRTLGAQLRNFIIGKCKAYATTVKGEHEQLISIHKQRMGAGHNLCSMERDMAKYDIHAVVIIPDSPGSFVELGMFAFEDRICSKTLVLFNGDYEQETEPSFMHRGPKLAYRHRGASIEFVNYRKKELAWGKVYNFLHIRKTLEYDRLN